MPKNKNKKNLRNASDSSSILPAQPVQQQNPLLQITKPQSISIRKCNPNTSLKTLLYCIIYGFIGVAGLPEARYASDFPKNPYAKWIFAGLGEFSNLYSGSLIVDFTNDLFQTSREEYTKFCKNLCSCRGIIFIASSTLLILPTSFLTSFSEKGMADQEFAGNTTTINSVRILSTIASMPIEFLVDTIINEKVLYNFLLGSQPESSEDQLSAVVSVNTQHTHTNRCSILKGILYLTGGSIIAFSLLPNEILGAETFSQSTHLNLRAWSSGFISLIAANTLADFLYFFIPTKQAIDLLCSKHFCELFCNLFCKTTSEQPKPPQSICSKVVSIISYSIAAMCTGFYTIALIEMADKNSDDPALRIIKTLLAGSQIMLSVPYFLGVKDNGAIVLNWLSHLLPCFKATGTPEPEKESLLPAAEADSKSVKESDSEKGIREIEEKPATSGSWYRFCCFFCLKRYKPQKRTINEPAAEAKEERKTYIYSKPCAVATV